MTLLLKLTIVNFSNRKNLNDSFEFFFESLLIVYMRDLNITYETINFVIGCDFFDDFPTGEGVDPGTFLKLIKV